ncbi:methionyl-tRNA synthetase [Paenibacillus taihuensis]|uniref:Methionine--tRNA ligase n=1 Tax=Paenibacillus taihuensis TaxID=1156355 RepID=A0A3D9S711_9BACL|nr:methionine--tRNA ligase [Paenibacillus taihuensis]REE88956.1 methionyl-tRNA synthetase [Paenibacillus taihuensis]
MRTIFIGGAWPYANGSLHLGRLASLLPGDVLARYHRSKGDQVLYVSGSDCHGTPVAVQASQAGVSPREIADKYHEEFKDCFNRLNFTYDLYTRTDEEHHHKTVQQIFLQLLEHGYLDRRTVEQTYCEIDQRFLPDRYVEGICPVCGEKARGDQCDYCSTLLDPSDLLDRKCKLCGNPPVNRETEHFYLLLSKLQDELRAYTDAADGWRDNAVQMTERYLAEGLLDRAVTRDLDWGVDVPVEGFEGKKIYVWIEAVSGYLSASIRWAETNGADWRPFWAEDGADTIAYYVHGKDNIPFHTLIWPAILSGAGNLHRPDRIISSEYMTLEGKKFSTSRNWAVWVPDILERYSSDSIRYFLIANGPERRDTDFSWREFIHSHNGELLGAFGNFVNRTLAFITKSFHSEVPSGSLDNEWSTALSSLFDTVGELIEAGRFKEAVEQIFSVIRRANKYFDEEKPWNTYRDNPTACAQTLYVCTQIIANLSSLLNPFLPAACARIRAFLAIGDEPGWELITVPAGQKLSGVSHLFERIPVERIKEEEERLEGSRK